MGMYDIPLHYYAIGYFFILFGRYFVMSLTVWTLFWIKGKERFAHRRIQALEPPTAIIRGEFWWSVSSMVIFTVISTAILWMIRLAFFDSKVYLDPREHTIGYMVFTLVLAILWHDMYFYWTHRWMHHPRLFKLFHAVHHRSINPTPWAAFSFHPTEAVIEALVYVIFPFIIPVHPFVLVAALTIMNVMNVLGHSGYEFFPSGWLKRPLGKWLNTSVHHNMHHRRSNCNYGLYFNWWDRWCHTNASDYEAKFEEVAARQKPLSLEIRAAHPGESTGQHTSLAAVPKQSRPRQ